MAYEICQSRSKIFPNKSSLLYPWGEGSRQKDILRRPSKLKNFSLTSRHWQVGSQVGRQVGRQVGSNMHHTVCTHYTLFLTLFTYLHFYAKNAFLVFQQEWLSPGSRCSRWKNLTVFISTFRTSIYFSVRPPITLLLIFLQMDHSGLFFFICVFAIQFIIQLKKVHSRRLFSLFTFLQYSLESSQKGQFLASFFFIFSFTTQLPMFNINFVDDWFRTADLWCRKRPLYHLSHDHCPSIPLYFHNWWIELLISCL